MGGPSLEVARIAMYMAVPVAFFYFVGMPSFRKEHVRPMRKDMFPDEVNMPPKGVEANRAFVQRLREERERQAALQQSQQQASTSSS